MSYIPAVNLQTVPNPSRRQILEAISANAHRYSSPTEMLEHLHRIASCTRWRSGCFGIGFPLLIPVVEELAINNRFWEGLQ